MGVCSAIKNNKILYSWFWKSINRLPRRWVYPDDFFKVYGILDAMDRGEDIQPFLSFKLAAILTNALETVPYYRDLNLGLKAVDINADNAFSALYEFPFLEKKTVMENPAAFISNRFKVDELLVDTSGGSTGQGIKLFTSGRQKFIELAFSFHEWEKFGWYSTSRVVRMGTDGKKKEHEDPFSKVGDRLLISPYHLEDKWLPAIYQKICDFRAEYFHAYPSCFLRLTKYLKEKGQHLSTAKGIFLYSEGILPEWVELIHEVFPGIPLLIHYGLSERTNFAWGHCQNGKLEYSLVPAYGLSENFSDNNGNYEIVGTSYWNDVMPLIRYRTQDYGLIEKDVIKSLDGRSQEFLTTRNGQRIPGLSISIDKFTWDYIDIFQVVQNEPGKLEFHLQPRKNFNEDIKKKILRAQQEKWGGFFDIDILICPHIQKTASGKTKLIVNNIT